MWRSLSPIDEEQLSALSSLPSTSPVPSPGIVRETPVDPPVGMLLASDSSRHRPVTRSRSVSVSETLPKGKVSKSKSKSGKGQRK